MRRRVVVGLLTAALAHSFGELRTASAHPAEPEASRPSRPIERVPLIRPEAKNPPSPSVASRFTRRFSVELEFGPVWQSRNEVAVPGDTGTRFDLDDLTGNGPFPYSRLTLDWRLSRRHSLRALVAPLEIRETRTLADPVSFNGVAFAAGVPTEATYRFNSYRVSYRYLLASGSDWSIFVGATAKIRDAKIALRQGSLSSQKSDLGFVPLLHVDAEWRPISGWRITADLDAAAAPQGRAFDFALKLHRDLSECWSIGLGYRTIEGGADNDKVYTFTWLHQAVVSVSYRF